MGFFGKIKKLFKKDEPSEKLQAYIIYTTKREFNLDKILQDLNIKANFENNPSKMQLSYKAIVNGSDITISHLDRNFPETFGQISGLTGYIMQVLKPKAMSNRLYDLFTKISQMNHMISIVVKPDDRNNVGMDLTIKLLSELKGILFYEGIIIDHNMSVYLGENDKHEEKAGLYFYESSKTRKANTIKLLAEEDFRIMEHLPTVISDEEVNLREPAEVARRAIIISLLVSRAEGLDLTEVIKLLEKYHLTEYLSEKEKEFLAKQNHEKQEIINTVWRFESANTLFWSLGLVEKLDFPNKACNPEDILELIRQKTPEKIIANAKLISTNKILDQLDLTYRLHWWAVDRRVKESRIETKADEKIDEGVVYERHYALNWLTWSGNNDWDNVKTET